VITEILRTNVHSGTRKPINNGQKTLTLLRNQKNGILKYTVVKKNFKITLNYLLGLWGTEKEGRREIEGELKKEGGKREINRDLKRKMD